MAACVSYWAATKRLAVGYVIRIKIRRDRCTRVASLEGGAVSLGQIRRAGQPLRHDPNVPDRDCGDCSTWAEAQDFCAPVGVPPRDPHGLDSDRDGIVRQSPVWRAGEVTVDWVAATRPGSTRYSHDRSIRCGGLHTLANRKGEPPNDRDRMPLQPTGDWQYR